MMMMMKTVNAHYDNHDHHGDHDEDHHLVISKESLDEGVSRPLQSECLVDENEIITSKQSNLTLTVRIFGIKREWRFSLSK